MEFPGTPGLFNSITDIAGIEVGHHTLVDDDRIIRTGVTAVLPRGKESFQPVSAAMFSLNGTGEFTQSHRIAELGVLLGPVMLTNTHSVGAVHAGTLHWFRDANPNFQTPLPAVAETYDGFVNDVNGFHVTPDHAIQAIEIATPGPVSEGNVGAGTGTTAFEYKAGIGTSSRRIEERYGEFQVGVLVQANCAPRRQLVISGVPVGEYLPHPKFGVPDAGSIIIVVATDAPLYPHELSRIAKRAAMGLARTGSTAAPESGDIILAFSTTEQARSPLRALDGGSPNDSEVLKALFRATVYATEEAIINSLYAAEPIIGMNGRYFDALPIDDVAELLERHGRSPQ